MKSINGAYNIASNECLWIRRTCDYIWMLTTAFCLALGLGLGLDWLVSGKIGTFVRVSTVTEWQPLIALSY